jgi:hypothetical protein
MVAPMKVWESFLKCYNIQWANDGPNLCLSY